MTYQITTTLKTLLLAAICIATVGCSKESDNGVLPNTDQEILDGQDGGPQRKTIDGWWDVKSWKEDGADIIDSKHTAEFIFKEESDGEGTYELLAYEGPSVVDHIKGDYRCNPSNSKIHLTVENDEIVRIDLNWLDNDNLTMRTEAEDNNSLYELSIELKRQ